MFFLVSCVMTYDYSFFYLLYLLTIGLIYVVAEPPKALDEDETEFLEKLEMVSCCCMLFIFVWDATNR